MTQADSIWTPQTVEYFGKHRFIRALVIFSSIVSGGAFFFAVIATLCFAFGWTIVLVLVGILCLVPLLLASAQMRNEGKAKEVSDNDDGRF